MTLWTKLEPLCRGTGYNGSFTELINSKKYGYFSAENYRVCGYFQEKFLLIGYELFKTKHLKNKKIYFALHIDLVTCETSQKVFKCFVIAKKNDVIMQNAIDQHISLEKDFPQAVAKAPCLLGLRESDDEKFLSVDTMEERYQTTLSRDYVLKGKLALADALQGLFNIASALNDLHKKSFVHRDVKNWNLFVANKRLLIFDFDLASKFPGKTNGSNEYEFWDLLSNRFGLVHPFCDVYGWTITLAIIVWGSRFHCQYRNDRHDSNLFFYVEAFPRKVSPEFYDKALAFIKNVIERDRKALKEVDGVLNTNPYKDMTADELFSKTHATLPTMQDCIEFIRPWVLHPTQAK